MLTYFITGILLAFTPCMLVLLPISTFLISKSPNKYLGVLIYLIVSTLLYGLIALGVQHFEFLNYLEPLLPVTLIISGLVLTEWLLIPPINVPQGLQNRLGGILGGILNPALVGLMVPLAGGSCILPIFITTLMFAENAGLALFVLNLGLNVPVVACMLLGSGFLKYISPKLTERLKKVLGYAFLGSVFVI